MVKVADRVRMDETALSSIIDKHIASSTGFVTGQLAKDRLKALEYYRAQKYGNEVDGASQVVTTEVRDTIESIMPSLARVFLAGDQIVRFEPVGPEDEETADQATDYCNHIFTKDNPGYQILTTAFRDGLTQKTGATITYWIEETRYSRERYTGLDDLEFQALVAADDVEVIEHTETDAPQVPGSPDQVGGGS